MHIYRLNQGEFRAWRDRAAREDLMQRIFGKHGETQVRAPGGRILGTARAKDRSGRVPIEKAVLRRAHHAVSPGECICREWQKPAGKEHEHHPICTHKAHWEAQQARSPDALRARALRGTQRRDEEPPSPSPELSTDTERPPPGPRVSPPGDPSVLPAPADCTCHEWAGAAVGKHHALCEFRERWEQEHGSPGPALVELETGQAVREAAPAEVAASKQKAEEDGVGAIELSDGKLYYVRDS
jgi:hypothetical protein